MKNHFNKIYLFVLVLFFGLNGYAQLFPVQLTPVFKSPYSVKISDYATSMDTKFQLLINPTDVTISQRQVRLKLYIQGNGVNIRSSDYITGQRPLFINGGEFQTLINTDISALFRLENLQGISPSQYANPLPDGMYDFCFEMYDYITNQKISQKSCASIYLILNDPPLLNTPQKNEQIAASDFPNIMFTWTPRQMNATNVSYKFELKQLIDPTLDPQFAFQMSPLLYEETLFSTAMLYNLSMPNLTPGMRYAWRVRAISTTGLSENAIFKNDGYSEIYSFKYTASCAAPTFLLSEALSPTSVKITWQGIPDHIKYQLQYKKQDVRNAQWFSSNSLNTQSLITNLEPGVTYQFRVGSSCDPATEGIQSFTYSAISTFTTPTQSNGVPAYNCGIIPNISIQNKKVLDNLIQSETFTAGDFPVTVLELQQEHSPYSGRGYIIVPYLNDTRIAVEFNNILINTDYQLISGVVETSYNPANIANTSNVFVSIESLINDIKEAVKEQTESGKLTKEEADEIINETTKQSEIAQKGKEAITEAEKQKTEEKDSGNENEVSKEQENKIETAKQAINGAHEKIKEIADRLGIKAGKGNRESDGYFQGLLPLAVNNGTVQIKQIDGNGVFNFKTTDTNFLETYSTIVSGKKYTFVITTSNSTKEELEKAKSLVDNPTDGIVIYNHYDLKNNKLGYKVNFANNFFDGIKAEDIEEIKALYTEALNNSLDEAENVTDWAGEIFKATTFLNKTFQDLINKIELPESIWNPADKDFAGNKYKMEALDAGVIDGALDEIKSIPLLISIVVDYTTSKETFDKINQAFSDFSFKETIKNFYEERKELYTGQSIPKIEHQTGRDVVAVGTLIGTGGLAGVTKVKKGLNFVEDLVKVVKTKGAKETGELVKDAIKKKLDDIAKYFTTKEWADRIADRFGKYKGQLTKAEWLERYKTLYKNREIGKLTEDEFQLLEGGLKPKKGIVTSDGKRYFDNVLDGTAREVKSGPVTLSKYKDQISKDIEILKRNLTNSQITKIEWHCFDEVDMVAINKFIKDELKDKSDYFIIIKH